MKKIIKKLLPQNLINFFAALFSFAKLKIFTIKNNSDMFLLQTPVHQNYGDHAIAYAELMLFEDFKLTEITDYQLNALLKYPLFLKSIITLPII